MKKILYAIIIILSISYSSSLSAQKIFIRALGKASDNTTLFNGGSVVLHHENEIEATVFSETDTTCGFLPNGGTCKTTTGPWVFNMSINASVVDFKTYMYSGKRIGKVTVTLETESQIPFNFYTVVMTNVFVKMISESSGGSRPVFYIQLDPSTIQWTYTEQKDDGTAGKKTSFGWDRVKNIPL